MLFAEMSTESVVAWSEAVVLILGGVGAFIIKYRKSMSSALAAQTDEEIKAEAAALKRAQAESAAKLKNEQAEAAAKLKNREDEHLGIRREWQEFLTEVRAESAAKVAEFQETISVMQGKLDELIEHRVKCESELAAAKAQIQESRERIHEQQQRLLQLENRGAK